MGKADVVLKQWLKNKERFADLFNAVVFDGEQVIKPEELEEINSESGIVIENAGREEMDTEAETTKKMSDRAGKVRYRTEQRFRDLVMRWKGEAELAVLALENQEKIHYAMPVRGMLYDALSYTDQMRLIWGKLSEEEKKNVDANAFFSRFRKQDKLCPVISIIFYYGEEKWDGAIQLYELFGVEDRKLEHILEKYVSNYKMNLIEVKNIEDITKYKSDLQIIFHMLRYRKDKRRLLDYTKEHRDYFECVDYESLQAMVVLLNAGELLAKVNEKKGVDGNMCQALEEYYQDGVQEGIEKGILLGRVEGIEQGIEQGIEKGIVEGKKSIVINMMKKGFDIELIADVSNLPIDEVQMLCSEG